MIFTKISGTGSYAPKKILTNQDLEKMVDTTDEWITERSGIKERHIASEGEKTSDFAYEASLKALEMAGLAPDDIDLIIVCTVTPDYGFPAVSCIVKNKLGSKKAAAYDLSAGCTGLIYGMGTANAMIKSGLFKHILVVGAETLTSIVNWDDRSTCVLFGDGAGAVVLSSSDKPGIIDFYIDADSKDAMELSIPAGGSANPLTVEKLNNNENKIYMNGSKIFKLGVRAMANSSKKLLKRNNLKNEDIDWLIPHQANLRIIQSVAHQVKLDESKIIINLQKYGNTSAASIGIALDEAVREKKIIQGHKILLTAFGAGLTWGSLLFEY